MTPQTNTLRNPSHWRAALAWDGLLPMGLAAFTGMLRVLYPKVDSVELFALIILPMFAALLRASVGAHQLHKFSGTSIWWRQTLLAVGIVLLLLIEAANAAITFADDCPFWPRLIPAGIYACYLPVIILAF